MNGIILNLCMTPTSKPSGAADNGYLEKLDALEAAITAAKDEIKFRVPSAPVLGLNSDCQLKFFEVGLARNKPVRSSMDTDPIEEDRSASAQSQSEVMDAYAVLDDSTGSA